VNRCPYEVDATIRLHRQALLREAERVRLLAAGRPRRAHLAHVLARTGRLLVAVGTRLEARYTGVLSSADYADSRRFFLRGPKSV